MSCLWGENDRSLKNDDCVFKNQGRIMFFIPGKIADFTDEVAKSRMKIFQLWRKLLAFTFGFIKKKHPVAWFFDHVDIHVFLDVHNSSIRTHCTFDVYLATG